MAVAVSGQKIGDEVRLDQRVHRELAATLAARPVKAALQCGPLTFPSFRLIPDAKLILDNPEANVRGRAEQPVPATGVAVTIRAEGNGRLIADRYGHPGINLPVDEQLPQGFKQIWPNVDSGYFVASSRCRA